MGSLESWLLLRSLKTLHLRVPRQSETAKLLVDWLHSLTSIPKGVEIDGISGGMITKVWHSSLQKKNARGFDPAEQMEGGWNATFAILASNYAFFHIIGSTKHEQLATPEYASRLPHLLNCFTVGSFLVTVNCFQLYFHSACNKSRGC
jgi:cystathionine gamma-synthase